MVVRKWLDNNFYGAIWSLVFQGQIAEWSIGGGANRYDGDHFGNITWMEHPGTNWPGYVWYRNNGLKNEFNIYGKINARISGSISGFADLQFRSVGYALSGRDDDMRNLTQKHSYGFFNPKAGLFWNNGGGSDAYLSVAVAHREPTRSDFTDASGDAEVTPRPERLTDFEGGYTFRTADLSLGVNLYYMHYHDQLVPTGKISNTGYPVMTNVAVSYRTGIELTCSYRPSRIIGLKMNMTLSSSKIRNFRNYFFNYNTSDWSEEYTWSDLGNVDIAYSPGVVSSAEVQIDPLKNLGFRLTGKYIGKQYFDNTMSDDRSVDPYYFCNMTTEYTFSAGKMKEAAVRLAVNNFTDVLFGGNLYENNAYGGMWTEDGVEKTWSYFFPQAGINYMLGFSLTF